MGIRNFRTYEIALEFHRQCQTLRLKGSLADQLKRATESIVLNLAEGSAKPTVADRKRFYRIALGSAREVQAIFDLLDYRELDQPADKLAAHLYKLCTSKGPGG